MAMTPQLSMLVDSTPRWEAFNLPDADVSLCHRLFDDVTSQRHLATLLEETPWRQDQISMYGKTFNLPRLQQWYGDEGLSYEWSGIKMKPMPWTPTLLDVKRTTEEATGVTFNSVLLNRYRDGNDTVGWHADDERELGPHPVIATVSFGVERDFMLRHNGRSDLHEVTVKLPNGNLLLMGGSTQQCWKHQLPRRKHVSGERVNLTFRQVGRRQ